MKKTFIILAALVLNISAAQAQEDPAKLAKQAGKALTSYNIDPQGNAGKLDEAKTKIDEALKAPEVAATSAAWLTKGDVYNTLLQRDLIARTINPKAPLSGDNDALTAFEAYKMAFNAADAKKYNKKDASKGVAEVQSSLINIGVEKFEAQMYDKAYNSFKAALDAHELLKSDGAKSALDEPAGAYDNQIYVTALAASLAGKTAESTAMYEQLYKKGTDKPEVYSGLYKAKAAAKDKDGANKILEEGRKKFPDDTQLLFDEINLYLEEDRLEDLISRLQSAIDKEPTNVGLYVTLGNVYDNLHQKAFTDKNEAKQKEYFDMAMKYYGQATERDPKNTDATYAMGAMYYNKAAILTQELIALPDTPEGNKKYKVMKDEVNKLFDQALPFFQKAESFDPNDTNALQALTEIYARKEDYDLGTEFKKRLEVVRGGGKNPESYFKK
jgi:tetratricopeptide (TPR) repeat protein